MHRHKIDCITYVGIAYITDLAKVILPTKEKVFDFHLLSHLFNNELK